jgi:hypothetical protein
MKKLVKSLLLGSAAGLAAVGAVQAADLPVKAKAVEYVKVCSLYGAGFYYMPGTDTCLKVGGYVRVQYETGAWAGGATAVGGQAALTRTATPNVAYRGRGDITLDARTQTAYGTLRSYIRGGWQNTDGGQGFHFDRAFIQFAGFTFGNTQSFYDFLSLAPYGYSAQRIGSDTGALGVMLAAYTAQFGNGLSGTISLEQPRNKLLVDGDGAAAPTVTNDYSAHAKAFDVVANLRVDQAWGSAQVMAAAHNASGAYGVGPIATDHPSDKWGYALGAGVQFNIPGMKGDIIGVQVNYAKGAIGYVYSGSVGNTVTLGGLGATNQEMAYGNAADGVFSTALGGIDQTTAWGFTAVYQHLWSPALRTSVWGGYTSIGYSDVASAEICPAGVAALRTCDEDFSFWQVGTRTAWFPHPDLEIGLDVMYMKLNTANEGPATGGTFADKDIASAIIRVQRNFLP